MLEGGEKGYGLLEGENACDEEHVREGREVREEEANGGREGEMEGLGPEDEADEVGERVDHSRDFEIVDEARA